MNGQSGRHLKAVAGGFLWRGLAESQQSPHAGREQAGDLVKALLGA